MPGLQELRADCTRCAGLCCVAPAFALSADFALDKPAGTPCTHLRADDRCGIHDSLRERGFPGCTVFDCLGAGQQLTQVTFGGRGWRDDPGTAREMFGAFAIMRDLHELLWYLTEAVEHPRSGPLRAGLARALDETRAMTALGPGELLTLDVPAHRDRVAALLRTASERARAGVRPGRDRSGADLAGARLRGADLRGDSLRGAILIGADLAGADLRSADLVGADLRGADLSGADLRDVLHLTQYRLNAARGDGATRLPPALLRPAHWPDQSAHHQPPPRYRASARRGSRPPRSSTSSSPGSPS